MEPWDRWLKARAETVGLYLGDPVKSYKGNRKLPPGAAVLTSLLCISFGANAVAIKICLAGMGPFTLAATRFAIAAVAISIWAFANGHSFRLKRGQLRQVTILAAVFSGQTALFYMGIDKTSASRSTLISNLQPFLVLVLAHFFVPGDRINMKKIIGISMGFVGVLVVFLQREGVTDEIRTGDLLVFLAVILWGGNAIFIKRIIDNYQPFQIALFPMLMMVPLLLVAAAASGEVMIVKITAPVIGALAYQSLLTASLGFVLWNTLLQRYGVVAIHSYIFLIPISGVALGGIILGEPVATAYVLAALVLIVIGITIVGRSDQPVLRNPSPPPGR